MPELKVNFWSKEKDYIMQYRYLMTLISFDPLLFCH